MVGILCLSHFQSSCGLRKLIKERQTIVFDVPILIALVTYISLKSHSHPPLISVFKIFLLIL